VASSITTVVAPETKSYADVDSIYTWLHALVKHVYTDAVCGNDLCESPYERKAFGRFGCQVDCGLEEDLHNVVVKIQAASRAPGDVDVSLLVASVRWNICLRQDMPGVKDIAGRLFLPPTVPKHNPQKSPKPMRTARLLESAVSADQFDVKHDCLGLAQ
ncbi:hypothetical protein CYMTET_28320, partial [Cymbomonas tetramitiformis]